VAPMGATAKRAKLLREQAMIFRDIAARSTQYTDIHEKLLALAREVERLADRLAAALAKSEKPRKQRTPGGRET
jgi:hypothetical protein